MSSSDILPPETSVSDRLLTTAFLTALLHLIVVLGVTFQVAAPPDAGRVPSLDIMLVSDEIPESRTNDEAQYLSQRTTRQKLMAFLSDEAQHRGKSSFTIEFNRQQLADFLSVDRSAMSSELSRMKEDGLIDFERNDFVLKNL